MRHFNQTTVSMTARIDKGSEIVQRQLGFVDVSSNRDAAAISLTVKNNLSQHTGVKEKLIMQTYDGAAVISGQIIVATFTFVKNILLHTLFIVLLTD